jgi:hypothetical protein
MEASSLAGLEPGGKQPMLGKDIARRVKKSPPGPRAALAARVTRGEAPIISLTTRQTALLFCLSNASVSLAKSATDEDLTALKRGALSLRALRAKRRKASGDSAIRAFVRRTGIEAVLSTIDAMTAPTQTAAE